MREDLRSFEMCYKGNDASHIVSSGLIKETQDGGWILNSDSSFPLTVYGINQKQAIDMRIILDSIFFKDSKNVEQRLERLILQTELRCKEVDEYLGEFRPQYTIARDTIREKMPHLKDTQFDEDDDDLRETAWNALLSLDKYPEPIHPDMLFLDPPKAVEVARLLWQTHLSGARAAKQTNELGEYGKDHIFRFWEIYALDACPFCRRTASKIYDLCERPRVPLHIGCKCSVLGLTRKDYERLKHSRKSN